jgi:hypothetical protein
MTEKNGEVELKETLVEDPLAAKKEIDSTAKWLEEGDSAVFIYGEFYEVPKERTNPDGSKYTVKNFKCGIDADGRLAL